MEEKTLDQSTTQSSPDTPIAPQPASSPLPQDIYPSPRHFPKKAIITFTLLFIMLSIFGTTWAYKDQIFQSNQTPTSITVTPTKTTPRAEDPTADWKTYKNELYGFEYPANWEISQSSNSSILLKKTQNVPAQGAYPEQSYTNNISISVREVPKNTTLDEFLDDTYKYANELLVNIKQGRKVQKIAGVDSYRITIPGAAGYYTEGVILLNKTNGYHISASGLETNSGIQEALDQILSTFKFTDIDATDTSKWKTYRNEEYGFEFQYPSDSSIKTTVSNNVFSVTVTKMGLTQKDASEYFDGISLSFYVFSLNGRTLQEVVDYDAKQSEIPGIVKHPYKVILADKDGYSYISSKVATKGSITKYYFPLNNSNYLRIMDSTSDPTNSGYSKIVNQILSTFKFTN